MIVSTSDYLRHYDHKQVITFLEDLFRTRTVLFIGYGLEETEILEHILRKGMSKGNAVKQRFMLYGFYSHQEKTFAHLYEYYKKSFGVYLCPFFMDLMDHKQLESILDDWSKLKVGTPLLAEDLKAITEAADE